MNKPIYEKNTDRVGGGSADVCAAVCTLSWLPWPSQLRSRALRINTQLGTCTNVYCSCSLQERLLADHHDELSLSDESSSSLLCVGETTSPAADLQLFIVRVIWSFCLRVHIWSSRPPMRTQPRRHHLTSRKGSFVRAITMTASRSWAVRPRRHGGVLTIATACWSWRKRSTGR